MTKRGRCAFCKARFKPRARGRPPRYCCPSHRQRAYERRRLRRAEERGTPLRLMVADFVDVQARERLREEIRAVLREMGLLPTEPQPPKPRLKLVKPQIRLSDPDYGA